MENTTDVDRGSRACGCYPPDLWEAAMLASYAIEGVKDQREINYMVADSLLKHRDRYASARSTIVGWLDADNVALLDRHHAG